ncbi:MAG: 2'-deoxycytidine 5'-triphosphate deaminase [Patescibacteria group bacterium]|nr:2'-deoxycytidine 5'-triphosphate deaminase [Patescibacteria group bacterium]
MKKIGVLPSQMIKDIIKGGHILGAKDENINPSSLDLSISEEIYRVEGIFQPRPSEKITDILQANEVFPHDLNYPLERGVVYLCRLKENMALPEKVYGYCNPKSSTGRNDVHVRVLANNVSRYDTVTPAGYKGDLWVAIHPRSFPIRLFAGLSLVQLRLFNQDTRFDETELQIVFDKERLLWSGNRVLRYEDIKVRDNDGSVILTLGLSDKIAGFQCLGSSRVFDFSKTEYNPEDFFTPLFLNNGYIRLKAGGFYILTTKEAIRVPPYLSCEMAPMDERSGEFRSHYAGFVDSGWGWGRDGEGKGRPLTLEVRPFEDLIVRDNQPFAKIRFERMTEKAERNYDQKENSNYKEQYCAKLSKHFT